MGSTQRYFQVYRHLIVHSFRIWKVDINVKQVYFISTETESGHRLGKNIRCEELCKMSSSINREDLENTYSTYTKESLRRF